MAEHTHTPTPTPPTTAPDRSGADRIWPSSPAPNPVRGQDRASTPKATDNHTPTNLTRRAVALGGGAAAAGIVAGASASVPSGKPAQVGQVSADAELLALRPRLQAALRQVNASEMSNAISAAQTEEEHDAWVAETGEEFDDACWAIVDAPKAQTTEGRALKAAAAMYQLRAAYVGHWPGSGEAMAWDVLSELAGEAYTSPAIPAYARDVEPGRA